MANSKTYYELLKDPRWQKLRLQVMERDNFSCACCCDTESTLNVHHKGYISGKKPWEYPMERLETLCDSCHAEITNNIRESTDLLHSYTFFGSEYMLELLKITTTLYPHHVELLTVIGKIIKDINNKADEEEDARTKPGEFLSDITMEERKYRFNMLLLYGIIDYMKNRV